MYISLFLYNFAKVIKRKDIIVGELLFLDYIIHFLSFTSLCFYFLLTFISIISGSSSFFSKPSGNVPPVFLLAYLPCHDSAGCGLRRPRVLHY